MPRKNNKKPQKIVRFQMNAPQTHKKRYGSEREAQAAADYIFLTRGVQLGVYRDIDGGWYLTSRQN